MNQALNTGPDCLKIGEWEFHVRSHELSRSGKTIRLEPRVASLLLYLARQSDGAAGSLVARRGGQ